MDSPTVQKCYGCMLNVENLEKRLNERVLLWLHERDVCSGKVIAPCASVRRLSQIAFTAPTAPELSIYGRTLSHGVNLKLSHGKQMYSEAQRDSGLLWISAVHRWKKQVSRIYPNATTRPFAEVRLLSLMDDEKGKGRLLKDRRDDDIHY